MAPADSGRRQPTRRFPARRRMAAISVHLGSHRSHVPTTCTSCPPAVLFANCPGGVAPGGNRSGFTVPRQHHSRCMINPNAAALVAAGIFPANNAVPRVEIRVQRRRQLCHELEGRDRPHRPQLQQQVLRLRTLYRRTSHAGLSQSASGAATTFRRLATPSAIRRIAPSSIPPMRSAQRSSTKSPSTTTATASTSFPYAAAGLTSLALPAGYDATNPGSSPGRTT